MYSCGVRNPTTDITYMMIYVYNNFSDGPYQPLRLSERNHCTGWSVIKFLLYRELVRWIIINRANFNTYALDSRDFFISLSHSLTLSLFLSFHLVQELSADLTLDWIIPYGAYSSDKGELRHKTSAEKIYDCARFILK